MGRADPAGRCSCLGCQASSAQEALQDARAVPAAGSPAGQTPLATCTHLCSPSRIHLFHCLWSPSLQTPLRFGGHTVHGHRCSRVRGDVGAARGRGQGPTGGSVPRARPPLGQGAGDSTWTLCIWACKAGIPRVGESRYNYTPCTRAGGSPVPTAGGNLPPSGSL